MEQVVLVDENNREIGTADKATVHTKDTPLHRGFSLFLFNSRGELLLTQRAYSKKTFPGVWTNTCCGHPGLKEGAVGAGKRRLKEELGLMVENIEEMAPYRYRFSDENGIVENEICPILVAHVDETSEDNFAPNKEEIADWQWLPWNEFLDEIRVNPKNYSPWSVEEAKILESML